MCQDCGCEKAQRSLALKRSVGGSGVRVEIELPRRVVLEHAVLTKNSGIAEKNRAWFSQHDIRALNLMSSPGAGKTLLLEKTAAALGAQGQISLLTGDVERDFDAKRLEKVGARVKQINTIHSCHLDAEQIHKECGAFIRPEKGILIIENVGNLVCPAAFDLGESLKIAMLSTTEGEDKPAKYPLLFRLADVIVISKMDLCPHLDWDGERCENYIRQVNPTAPIMRLSAKTGEGMDQWLRLLKN